MHIQWYTVYIIAIYNAYTCITICNVYTCPPDQLIRQGYESAPGLDIMLLKQQVLHVSRQASSSGSQAHPVQNIYRSSHPLLQFLPQKLAEWIADNLAEDLQLPPKPRQSEPWSTAALNQILQTCFVSDSHGINIHTFTTVEFESDLYRGVMRARCYPFNLDRHRFHGRNVKVWW